MTREEREETISTLEYIKEYCHYEYEKETIDKAQEALNQEPILKATNGDVIKAMFPTAETWVEYDSSGDVMRFDIAENSTLECFNLEWWNAPYKGIEE